MLRARLGTALLLAALAGCGDDGGGSAPPAPTAPPAAHACTEIGCMLEGVSVSLNRLPQSALEISLCIEKRCVKAKHPGGPQDAIGDFLPRARESVRVAVIVRKRGRVVARDSRRMRMHIDRPNGPDCPPPCRYIRARFDARSGTLVDDA